MISNKEKSKQHRFYKPFDGDVRCSWDDLWYTYYHSGMKNKTDNPIQFDDLGTHIRIRNTGQLINKKNTKSLQKFLDKAFLDNL